jgi:hypothetical protein
MYPAIKLMMIRSDETTVDDKPKEDTKSSAGTSLEDIKPVLTENIRRTGSRRGGK